MRSHHVILFRNLSSVWQFLAELYDLYRVFYSDLRVLQGCPSYIIISMADLFNPVYEIL